MTILPTTLPDNPGPDYGPLTFRDSIGGRATIYMGERQIGSIEQSSYLRATIYRVLINLGTPPRKAIASNMDQAKVFATQEVHDFFAGTPVRLEVRG